MTQPADSATNDKPPVQEFWSTLSGAEQQRLRELASQLDAATGTKPGTALDAIIATVEKNKKAAAR